MQHADDSFSEGEEITSLTSPSRNRSNNGSNNNTGNHKPQGRMQRFASTCCTQRALLSILLCALFLLFAIFTIVPVALNLAKAPNYFANLTQPLSLLLFCLVHAWLNLGFAQMVGFLFFTLIISFGLEELASLTSIPFGMLQYDATKYQHVMIANIPLEVPFSYFFLLYLSFVLSEVIVQGHKRTRIQHQTRIRKSLYQQCMIPVVASLICLGFHMVLEPIGNNANLWNYVTNEDTQSNVELIYFGVPIFSFVGWYLSCFFIFSLYLLYELLLDRFLYFVHQKLDHYNEDAAPTSASARLSQMLRLLQPPLSESGAFFHYLSLLLPIGVMLVFGMPYLLVVDPPMLRIVAFVTFYVPSIFAISRFRYKSKSNKYQPIN